MVITQIQSVFVLVASMTEDMEVAVEVAEATVMTGVTMVTVVMTPAVKTAVKRCKGSLRLRLSPATSQNNRSKTGGLSHRDLIRAGREEGIGEATEEVGLSFM